jgi:hypothetical protein
MPWLLLVLAAPLPPLVHRSLRVTGFVGQPRPRRAPLRCIELREDCSPHHPQQTILHRVVRERLETFLGG